MPEGISITPTRIKVFVDYWNLQLLINQKKNDDRVRIDWQNLGFWLGAQAANKVKITNYNYEGINIYTSYNPKKEKESYYKWVTNWLNRQPGIQVYCLARQPKKAPSCPCCHKPVNDCPHCKGTMVGTIEKGVDALIVTDMIRLAWEDAYDVAVLASSDRDLIPGVKYLDFKGKKIIQAGFPPIGSELAQACWASFDLSHNLDQIIRPQTTTTP